MKLASFKSAVRRAGLRFVPDYPDDPASIRTPPNCAGGLCPILALAWHRGLVTDRFTSNLNGRFRQYGGELGLSKDDIMLIINAADNAVKHMDTEQKAMRRWLDGVNQP